MNHAFQCLAHTLTTELNPDSPLGMRGEIAVLRRVAATYLAQLFPGHFLRATQHSHLPTGATPPPFVISPSPSL
jgi:hypothetical protein